MQTFLVIALGVLGLAHAAVQKVQDTPVTKVVELINEMKAKIEADGKAEQKVYDKFACWCEKTTARKAGAIEDAKESIEELSQTVLKLKGKTATLKAEIAQLEKDVAGNIDGAKEATSIRARETEDYEKQRSDLEQAIGALERAVGILTGAGEASALQQAELLSVTGGLRGALRMAPKGDDFGAISQNDRETVEAFVSNPAKFIGAQPKFSGIQQKGDYAPASGAIQGILKGMYDSFTADLESKNADQALKQKNYEELTATKDSELATLKATLAKKKETLGDDTKTMTDSSIERDETQAQLKADEKFFETTKSSCKDQADAWANRSRLRTEELAGINKAVEILSSDEASATFGRANSMLLQASQAGNAAHGKKQAAFEALKTLGRRHQSIRIAALAALVQTTAEGHFDVVINTVDKQLAELRQEELDDIDLRDYCKGEEDKTANEIEDLEHKMTNLQGLIDRLNAKKKELNADILKTEGDTTDTENAMAEALSMRSQENEDFKIALKDDMDAVALLASAIDALTSFYKNNKLPMGLLAKGAKVMAKEEPEYAMDEDKAPEALSKSYGGRSSEGGGIISIIGYIKEDLENEIATTKKAEAAAQQEFEAQRAAALKTLEALAKKKNTLEAQEADTDEKITDATADKDTANTMKGQKEKYTDSLKPRCEWIKGAFDTRKSKRSEEIDGLLEAKSSLAGSAPAFLQKRT